MMNNDNAKLKDQLVLLERNSAAKLALISIAVSVIIMLVGQAVFTVEWMGSLAGLLSFKRQDVFKIEVGVIGLLNLALCTYPLLTFWRDTDLMRALLLSVIAILIGVPVVIFCGIIVVYMGAALNTYPNRVRHYEPTGTKTYRNLRSTIYNPGG